MFRLFTGTWIFFLGNFSPCCAFQAKAVAKKWQRRPRCGSGVPRASIPDVSDGAVRGARGQRAEVIGLRPWKRQHKARALFR